MFTAKIFVREKSRPYFTQIDHDNYAEIFDCLRRINVIMIDFCQILVLYFKEHLVQKIKEGEVGSSQCHVKVTTNFENAEGNFHLANSLLNFFQENYR